MHPSLSRAFQRNQDLPQPCFEVPSYVLGVLGMVKGKKNYSCPPKVGGQMQKEIVLAFSMEIWALLRPIFLLLVSYFRC